MRARLVSPLVLKETGTKLKPSFHPNFFKLKTPYQSTYPIYIGQADQICLSSGISAAP